MNLIFLAQGSALKIFDRILPHLEQHFTIEHLGLFLADQRYAEQLLAGTNNFDDTNTALLKEWDITRDAKRISVDPDLLSAYEATYGQPNLWPPLIADRRLALGKNTKYTQDYAPRYSHQQMQQVLQLTVQRLESFFRQVQPHAIIGFNMVTLGEFLAYLIATQKTIPYWQIKNAKIANYVTLYQDPLRLARTLKARVQAKPVNPANRLRAQRYLAAAQQKNSTYEGHVILKPPTLRTFARPALAKKLAAAAAFDLIKTRRYQHDNQSAGLSAVWKFNVQKPLKALQQHNFLSPYFLQPANLTNTRYVFFPLHTEPEIALSIYGRHYQNQIEVIRNIAQSVPVTWRLVVKDHPRSLGLRSLQYYKKLLQIPNVQLVDPYLPSYDIIEHAQAVAVITSWVGFEAVMSKKPVITFGECTFNALPSTMVTRNKSYNRLARDLQAIIHNYAFDEEALLQHIAAIIELSHPINMYTEILAKPGRHRTSQTTNQTEALANFAAYIARTIQAQGDQRAEVSSSIPKARERAAA